MQNSASLASAPDDRKRRVSYFYESDSGNDYFGTHRIRLTHRLVSSWLTGYMEINRPVLAGVSDFTQFHSPEYIKFLKSVTLESVTDPYISSNLERFNIVAKSDVTVSHGLFEYCRAYAGGSICAAAKLNRQEADIAINWAGGMSRAKRDQASGTCYVNDVVLGILELLKIFKRVIYIDIGYLHGDAVEEAFYDTDRVMTVSFHKIGDSGNIKDIGKEKGKYYSLNAPLKDGLDDASLHSLFRPVINKAMEIYQPEAIVLQCGADSLAFDTSGTFNLSVKGHSDCLQYVRSFNVPLMVLGGGGGSLHTVARCWYYETVVALGIEEQLENNPRMAHFNGIIRWRSLIPNLNRPKDIEDIRIRLLMQLSQVMHAPSAQFQDTPSISEATEAAEVDMETRQNPRILSNNPSYESNSDEDWPFLG